MIKEILSEESTVSSLRVVMLGTFIIIFSVWAWLSITTSIILEIPESIVTLLGLLLATKWAQKGEENEKKK